VTVQPTNWRKSSRSTKEGSDACVEIADNETVTLVRDTKDLSRGHLTFSRQAWEAFLKSGLDNYS
jgi:hypothetical protein